MFKSRTLRGIRLSHKKHTRFCETVETPVPATVTIPMRQHIGAVCEPIVAVGDPVYVGQKIGDSPAFVSSPVHSPVSGVVKAREIVLMPNGVPTPSLTIESDGLQTPWPELKPPTITNAKELVAAVRESGIVGLGGAGFPAHVKLAYEHMDQIQALYINLAECEPYITSDNREVIENADGIFDGIELIMRCTGIPRTVICVEYNKPAAINALERRCAGRTDIEVRILGDKYPKGAEKVLLYEADGIVVGKGQLPADCGAIVMNVSTVSAIADYAKTGMPLLSRRLTVDGDRVPKPMNVRVLIGTPIEEVLSFCNISKETLQMVIAGGVMMGNCVIDTTRPVTKTANALLCFHKPYGRDHSPCIRCGKCVEACPIRLAPLMIEKAYARRDIDELRRQNVELCINCGCCSYVCPAKRDLSHKNQIAKGYLKAEDAAKKALNIQS